MIVENGTDYEPLSDSLDENGVNTEVDEDEVDEVAEAAEAAEEAQPEKPAVGKGVQKRFNELSRARYEALARAERAEQKLEQATLELEAKQATGNKPKLDDFKDMDEFIEALAEWKAEAAVHKALGVQARQAETQAAQANQAVLAANWAKSTADARTLYPDYDEVADENMTLPPNVVQGMLESDNGAALLYHFSMHPDEIDDLENLSPGLTARKLIKIEQKINKIAKKGSPAKLATDEPTADKKPAPPRAVAGSKNSQPVDPLSDKSSTAVWMTARQAAIAKERNTRR